MRLFEVDVVGGLLALGAGRWPTRRPPAGADGRTPIAEASYVVLDTELTGLKPRTDSIVSIGALHMNGGRILVGSPFSRVVRPRTELTGSSVVIHGITPAETSECPTIGSVLPELAEFCRGRIIVGHAVSIDMAFFDAEARRLGAAPLANPVLDTMTLHRFLFRRTDDHCAYHEQDPGPMDLFTLARRFDIPVNRSHDALYDAYITGQLLQHHLAVLPAHGVRTIGDLLDVGKP